MSNHPRSIFGPLLLITAGTIWLLTQSGKLPTSNLWALTHIWPYILIAVGVGLILRSYWQYANILMDILIIGGVVFSIVYAPRFNWDNPSMGFVFVDQGVHMGPSIPGSGNVIAETREVSEFTALKLNYPARVTVTQGNSVSVKIEAEDDILPRLQTRVRNNTLEIFYQNDDSDYVRPTKEIRITIIVKDLKDVDFISAGDLTLNGLDVNSLDISFSGAGDLKVTDITAKRFGVDLSGAGSMTANGKADNFTLSISGFGSFGGKDLQTQTADVDLSGAGSATLWVEEQLDATISGAGSVNYYGSPNVSKQVNGIGNISRAGEK